MIETIIYSNIITFTLLAFLGMYITRVIKRKTAEMNVELAEKKAEFDKQSSQNSEEATKQLEELFAQMGIEFRVEDEEEYTEDDQLKEMLELSDKETDKKLH